jgi:hypothetical protein
MSYDADTQTYSYRDSDGSYWEGTPGCKYGKLYRVLNATPPLPSIHIPADPAALEQQYVLVKDCAALRHLLQGVWRRPTTSGTLRLLGPWQSSVLPWCNGPAGHVR